LRTPYGAGDAVSDRVYRTVIHLDGKPLSSRNAIPSEPDRKTTELDQKTSEQSRFVAKSCKKLQFLTWI